MDLIPILLLISGALVVALGLFDALRTAIAAGGGGPLTNRLAHGLWHAALRWHRRGQEQREGAGGGHHRLLSHIGPTVLLGIVLTWVAFAVAGYFLMYSADPPAVVRASSGVPAGFWERLYFTGFTVSTLGLGDFIPKGPAARMLTVFASLSGFFIMTLTVTYAMPVISAVVAKRRLASSIAGLGLTPTEILRGGWDGESLASLEQPLLNLASGIEMHTQRHLAYPVLHIFHIAQPRAAVAPRIAALSEALRLMRHLPAEAQPPPAAVRSARCAIDGFLSLVRSSFVPSEQRLEAPDRPVKAPLRAAGLPTPPEEEERADGRVQTGEDGSQQERRRRLLRALARDDGWTWADVVQADPPPLP